ncbi:MAG: hypothetical protein HOK81_11055, partial [Rhodospirillaceae bacterium]|nr:hypothetical protein [Rhodospirillaceae bacterium]
SPIAQVNGVFNAVVADGDYVDTAFFQGRGAGEGPTASSVVADIVDIARGIRRLIEDDGHRARVAAEGPAWAQRFSCRAMAEGYLAVYRALAKGAT